MKRSMIAIAGAVALDGRRAAPVAIGQAAPAAEETAHGCAAGHVPGPP